MANGLVLNGVVQGLGFGLGNVATWSSGGVPTSYIAVIGMGSGRPHVANAAMKSLCQGELIPGVGSPSAFAPANTCDLDGSMACSWGSPQSALSGLGGLGKVTSVCGDWAAVMNQMQTLLTMAEERGLTSTMEYVAARNYFDNSTGFFGAPVLRCGSATQTASSLYTDLNRRLGNPLGSASQIDFTPPPLLQSILPDADKYGPIVKWVAIGVVALAGAYALGPIFRGIGGLIPSRKR